MRRAIRLGSLLYQKYKMSYPCAQDMVLGICKDHNIVIDKVLVNNRKFTGMIYYDGRYVIVINSYLPAERQVFTIAHELGHFFLHCDEQIECGQKELEAMAFASALIMPFERIRHLKMLGYEVKKIAQLMGVCEKSLQYRLNQFKACRP